MTISIIMATRTLCSEASRNIFSIGRQTKQNPLVFSTSGFFIPAMLSFLPKRLGHCIVLALMLNVDPLKSL